MLNIRYVVFLLGIILAATAEEIGECEYFDSVDLGDSEMLEDGSYLYKNILIPSEKVQEFDYRKTLYDSIKIVDKYKRACLCQIKSCVLLCCEPTKSMRNFAVNMTLSDGTETEVNVINEFVVQAKYELSCDILDDPTYDSQSKWKLFQNGSLYNLTGSLVGKEDYCLVPLKIEDEYYHLVPQIVKPQVETHTELDMISAVRVISVFCMIIIISVYLYLPKFRTVYSRCCLCYFICLAISFLMLWAESQSRAKVSSLVVACYFIGYCGYYVVMSTFLWLLVINYNLWNSFTNYEITQKKSMQRYHIFVWVTAAILFVITASIEYHFQGEEYPDDFLWQPGVGLYYCWINTESKSAMIYYYGPILLGIIINLTLSIITARHIYVENRENTREWSSAESQKSLKNKSDFIMFFRMFAIAGVIWVLEILSYLFEINITLIFDLITSGQGLLLLFVTIWKRDVIKALHEKLEINTNNRSEPTHTTTTID